LAQVIGGKKWKEMPDNMASGSWVGEEKKENHNSLEGDGEVRKN